MSSLASNINSNNSNDSNLPDIIYISFRTKDLNLAAFMWCQPGSKLDRLDGSSGQGTTVFFNFRLPIIEQELAKLIMLYANGDALVNPLDFSNKQSQLRDLLHASISRSLQRSSK